jgi:hypothetical protein
LADTALQQPAAAPQVPAALWHGSLVPEGAVPGRRCRSSLQLQHDRSNCSGHCSGAIVADMPLLSLLEDPDCCSAMTTAGKQPVMRQATAAGSAGWNNKVLMMWETVM